MRSLTGKLGFVLLTLVVVSSLITPAWGSAPTTLTSGRGQATQEKDKGRNKDQSQKYRRELNEIYKRWLEEDVRWIITEEERTAFKKLETDEEREQFIEQFWLRRDPNPDTLENEYREEHFRRIAYANQHYSSGIPGWKTDRGRIYITFGPPDGVETHPAGGSYERPFWEGGGTTSTFPFETWFYRYIEGVGSGVEIEFVDPTMSGEYRIARSPDEKDALLFVPGAGMTLAEQLGLASKADRPYFSPGNRENYPLMSQRVQDMPFERLQLLANLQRPPKVKFNDLATIADSQLTVDFDILPFLMRTDYLKITDNSILTVFTILLDNQDMSFQDVGGVLEAKVNIHARIRPVTGRRPFLFEDVVHQKYTQDVFDIGVKQKSVYQHKITLPPGHYVADLVLRDINSGRTGVLHYSVQVPRYAEDQLSTSSLIISDKIEPLHGRLAAGPFVMGNLKVRPSVNTTFKPDQPIGLYLEIYNPGIDQTTLRPAVEVEYIIKKGGKEVMRMTEDGQSGLSRFTTQQITVARLLPVDDLAPGEYTVEVRITDNVKQATLEHKAAFKIEKSTGDDISQR